AAPALAEGLAEREKVALLEPRVRRTQGDPDRLFLFLRGRGNRIDRGRRRRGLDRRGIGSSAFAWIITITPITSIGRRRQRTRLARHDRRLSPRQRFAGPLELEDRPLFTGRREGLGARHLPPHRRVPLADVGPVVREGLIQPGFGRLI